ncbi:hypothetical protein D1818_18555 [Aquimarina sp. BL5]|uniref:hypothetical protein n=1 Tax=Aquimarina sp. BL5 TaxID=1714860 RepID=UPI000E47BEE4|nr:hypothetical protein [Aquimarina sp. BL5]AXT52726.1 hypothetical protein D1818_18555 [Aquimarina sp. BL5]RKN08312.1 hypothetical protein D7036_06165 [Aquimarina sp. BL5]
MGVPQQLEYQTTNNMKTLKFLLLAVLLGLNLVSCDPPTLQEEVGVEEVETTSLTEDDDEDVDPGK